LVIFTEHRDTPNYLDDRITTLLGRKGAVVIIHGGIGREERLKVQEAFKFDPEVQVLLATDAAGVLKVIRCSSFGRHRGRIVGRDGPADPSAPVVLRRCRAGGKRPHARSVELARMNSVW
jgi:superfamily II DNA/RNA helicase